MSILLTILKVIGIVLLVLLCILLLLVCCVLFVPIRYQAYIKKNETLQAKVKVSYLLRIFTVFFGYDDGKQSGKVKILGITIRDFFPTEEKKKRLEEKEKKKEEKRRKKEAALKKKEAAKRKKEAESKRKKTASKQKNSKDVKEVNQTTKNQQLQTTKQQTAKQQTTKDKQITKDKQTTSINTSNHSVKLTVSVDVVKEETSREANKENVKEASRQVKQKEQANSQADKQTEISEDQMEEKKKPTLFERIKELKDKVVTFCKKIIDKVKNIKYTICNLWDKLQHLKEIILFYYEILTREESKRAIEKLKTQSGRLFKHVKPRKVKGIIEFGFDDPATTGDIFGKVCMLYPIYGNNIVIIPRFEEELMKGELVIKGRIQIAVLLHIAWKIIFDKEIRTLYEALTGGNKDEQ